MPTGYTSEIANGISFEQFLLGCARAFGALIEMRDEPTDIPIPKKFKPDKYHKEAIMKTQSEIRKTNSLTILQIKHETKAEYQKNLDYYEDAIKKANELRSQYEAMLVKAKEWKPPTLDHQELQDFMIEQITISIKNDCRVGWYEEEKRNTKLLDWVQWKKRKLAKLKEDLKYHKEEYAKEVKRVADRNDWIGKLRTSIIKEK